MGFDFLIHSLSLYIPLIKTCINLYITVLTSVFTILHEPQGTDNYDMIQYMRS